MYLNKKETDAINGAIDFISTNIDCAEDPNHYHEILKNLDSALRKGWRAQVQHKRSFKDLVAKKVKEILESNKFPNP